VSWENRIVWSEGLFLQPQHFQQQDRYLEALVHGTVGAVAPYPWGFTKLTIDEEMLTLGKFGVSECAGVLPDGTPFSAPHRDDAPPAIEPPEDVKNCVVYLTLPVRHAGAREFELTRDESSVARFQGTEITVHDTVGGGDQAVTLAVGRLRMRFMLEMDERSDMLCIPIAKIVEVQSDKQIVLDRSFAPSAMDARAAPAVHKFVGEIEGLLSHRAEALGGRLSESGATKGVAEIQDFLLLMVVNRMHAMIRHLRTIPNAHPATIYGFLISLAGELATFMAATKRPPEFPIYKHDDLTNTFQPVMRTLRQYLSAVLEQTAISIPIEPRKYGVYVAVIADKRLVTTASFVLAVKAETPVETVRRHFPTQAKLGPVEQIRQLVNSALPGIALRPLPVAPRQIPYHAGVVYFEMDPDSQFWRQMTTSGGLAVHVAGDYPGLEMELWAIRKA